MKRLIYTARRQVSCFYMNGFETRTVIGMLYATPRYWHKTPSFRTVLYIPYTDKERTYGDEATNLHLRHAAKEVEVELLQKKDLFLRRLLRLIKLKKI